MNKIKTHNTDSLLIKNKNFFLNKRVFFSGLSNDFIINKLNLNSAVIHTYEYDVWKKLKKKIFMLHIVC